MDEQEFILSIVPRKSLCCIVCTVDYDDIKDTSAKSSWHSQKLKCRLLIYLLKDNFIIGSPVPRSNSAFYIIVTNDFYKNEILNSTIKKLYLHVSEPQPVTARAYMACIKYTITFYLSPEWNSVASLYIQDDDFWNKTERCTAVQTEIRLLTPEGADVDKISIKVTPVKAKLFPIRVQDFCVPHSVTSDFLASPNGIIDVAFFGVDRVPVLPSMKMGKVLRILKKIPSTCPYPTWIKMRRFWKNMYGYRLPKTDDGIIFYDIKFPTLTPNDRFIYPDLCIKSRLEQTPYGPGAEAVVNDFITHLRETMPNICIDEPMGIDPEPNNIVAEMETPVNQQNPPGVVESSKLSASTLLKNFNSPSTSSSGEESTSQIGKDDDFEFLVPQPTKVFKRQLTRAMSPTKSLLRKSVITQPLNFDNLKKIQEFHQPISQTQPSLNIFKNTPKVFDENSQKDAKPFSFFNLKESQAINQQTNQTQSPFNIFENTSTFLWGDFQKSSPTSQANSNFLWTNYDKHFEIKRTVSNDSIQVNDKRKLKIINEENIEPPLKLGRYN